MSETQAGALEAAVAAAVEPDPAARVLDAAMKVAASAPARRGTYVSHAKIYWPYIEELREALEALGIEWRPPVITSAHGGPRRLIPASAGPRGSLTAGDPEAQAIVREDAD